jgi:hypothetical protein
MRNIDIGRRIAINLKRHKINLLLKKTDKIELEKRSNDGPYGFPLARSGDFEGDASSWSDPNPVNHYGFGGSHPGICNFCLGDGSVRSISVTTPDRTLAKLSNCNDGIPTSVP